MPSKDNSGKVIVSLLAGATAGIVAGLLLAPETGEDTRKTLVQSASKLLDGNLGQLLKGVIARVTGPAVPATDSAIHADRQAADALLSDMGNNSEPGDLATPAGAGNGRSIGGDRADDVGALRS